MRKMMKQTASVVLAAALMIPSGWTGIAVKAEAAADPVNTVYNRTFRDAWEQDSVEIFVDENHVKTTFYQDDGGQYRINKLMN